MKKLLLSILLIASFVFVGLPMNLSQANAASYKEHFPTYSLYTKDNIIEKEISYQKMQRLMKWLSINGIVRTTI